MTEIRPICPNCSYPLGGLPDEGACPECGQEYTFDSARVSLHLPSASGVLLTLAFPLGLFIVSIVLGLVSGVANSFDWATLAGLLMPISLLWLCIATPVVLAGISRRHREAGGRGKWWRSFGGMGIAIRIVATINITIMTVLALGLGSCLVVILMN